MKPLLITACFLYLSLAVAAQPGSIRGTVTDILTNLPLSYVSIQASTVKRSFSDDGGLFYLANIAPGSYELSISHVGYQTTLIPVEVRSGATTTVAARMKRAEVRLADVVLPVKKGDALQTIAALDIRLRPITTAQEVLRVIPGLFIAQHAGGGKAEQMFLRGYDLDHGTDIRITVDGLPVNMVSHAHGQGYSDLHFLIPETIEKVAFNYGPYAADKGNMATAGYADFYTKEVLERNSISLEGGQFGAKRATGLFRLLDKQKEQGRSHWYAATEYVTGDGYFESPQDFRRLNLVTRFTRRWKGANSLNLSASTFHSKWNASGQVPERAVAAGWIGRFGSIDHTEGGATGRTNLSAQWTGDGKKGWKNSAQLYYTRYDFRLYSNFTFFLKDTVNGDQLLQQEGRNLTGYNGLVEKRGKWAGRAAKWSLGYGFRHDAVNGLELARTVKRRYLGPVQQGDVRELNSFVYLQQEARPLEQLHLTLGLRFDHFDFGYRNHLTGDRGFQHRAQQVWSPKLHASYSFTPGATLFAAAGTGFHSNDTRVILEKQAGNPVPRVFGLDAGLLLKPAPQALVKLTLWRLYGQQEFIYVGDEGIVEPGGRSRRMGADLSVRYQPAGWLFADADISCSRARLADAARGENHVPLAPSLTATGGLTARAQKGFSGSLRYRYLKDRPANEKASVIARGYFLLDARLNYNWKSLELFLSAENLLNREWKEAQFDTESRLQNEPSPVSELHFTPGSPRSVRGGVRVSF